METCAILTTAANALMKPLHLRMPAILDRADFGRWLDPASEAAQLRALLRPYPGQDLEAFPVSTFVNNPRHEGTRCAYRVA